MKVKIVFCLVILSIISLAGGSPAKACTCIDLEGICAHYEAADAVVTGKVEDIKPTELDLVVVGKTERREKMRAQEVKIKITRSFKGAEQEFITLLQPDTSCDWQFEESDKKTEYLFYLDSLGKAGQYKIRSCSRSGSIQSSADDLSWLNGLPKSKGRTRFSGVLSHYEDVMKYGLPRFTFVDYLVGTKITISDDKQTFTASTDKNGMFEFWDIPPGKYKVDPGFPKNYIIYQSFVRGSAENFESLDTQSGYEIVIQKGGCAGIDYLLRKTN